MSASSDLHDLIQLEIDGAATESERAALVAWLKTDAAAREEMRRMEELAATLSRVQPVDPPSDLVASVMSAVCAEAPARPVGFGARLRSLWPEVRVLLPYAYAATAGAAACLLAVQIVGGGSPLVHIVPALEAEGTMAPPGMDAVRRFPLMAAGLRGTATVRHLDGPVAVDIDLPSVEGPEVSFRFDPDALSFLGISSPSGEMSRLTVAPGSVQWSQSSGRRVTVVFGPRTPAAATVDVGIVRGGVRQAAGSLVLPGRS